MRFLKVTDNQQLTISETAVPAYTNHECLVKVAGLGINRADLLQKAGKYPPPKGVTSILGLEVCGTVDAIGSQVTELSVGDKVMALLPGGGYAEYVNVHAKQLIKLPEHFDITQGAGFIETFVTAYQALFSYGHLTANKNVLIHAGASGVGTAAITLAKSLGCFVAVTTSSEEKCQACLSLGADVAINYKEMDFEAECKANGWGFDVIVDVVAGPYLAKNINIANQDAQIVILAILGGRFTEPVDIAKMLFKRVSIHASTLRNRSDDYKNQLIEQFLNQFGEMLYTQGSSLVPYIYQSFSWAEVNQAHLLLEKNQTVGKVVLLVDDND